ncbi:MAG: glycosyltransferase [Chloroflexi bacterium]|nr:glycosyltransferase [Chloroflexota bacterium]
MPAKRILILTSDMGYGHRSAAKAVAAALEAAYGEDCYVEIVNPLEHERAPAFLRGTQADYDRLVREMPGFYRFGYEVVGSPLPNALIESAFTVMLYEALNDLLRTFRPDAIVNTYESYLAPLRAVFMMTRRYIPLLTVVTDLATVHRAWFNDVSERLFVPTQMVFDLGVGYGVAADKMAISGIPIHPRFAAPAADAAQRRLAFGWRADLTTVLAVGSKRVGSLYEALHVLNHSGLPLQLVIVAGGDDEMYEKLQNTAWHRPAHLYNFVDDMPALMQAADCIVCKAGGLTVTEALTCGLPILLVDVLHGQETGNAEYVLDNGAGEMADDPLQVLEIMCHWLENGGQRLQQHAENARKLARPRAAFEIAAAAWEAAQKGAVKKPIIDPADLSAVTDLLNRFDIRWGREEGT